MLVAGRAPDKEHRYLMDFGTNGVELYDLDKDIGEKKNVATEHPEVEERLQKLLDSFLTQAK